MNTPDATYRQIVVLGAAESGIGAAMLARQQGFRVFVSDASPIKESFRDELREADISFEENGHTVDSVLASSLVIKSPGIPEKAPIVQAIRAANIPLISEIEFAYRFKGKARIIAITGSNGKSTTTKLVHHILRTAGYNAALVGNIGISFARQIALAPADWYALEVSSFQLDDITSFRPDIGILLNITPDHLDRYNYDFEEYIKAKFNLTAFQNAEDFFILNIDDPIINQYRATYPTTAQIRYITMNQENLQNENGAYITDGNMQFREDGTDHFISSVKDMAVQGKHNQYNGMAAGIGARLANIRKEAIRESFSTFEGLAHRLEHVAVVRGVEFVNDSKATNVNSVWFALESMTKPVVLIMGGVDKGNNYGEIAELVREKVKAIVCLGTDNGPILEAFGDIVPEIIETQSAEAAAAASYSLAGRGDVVLLSPGCASFDLFKSYEDRGDQFKKAVLAL